MCICLRIPHSASRTAQRDTSGASSCNNIQPGFGFFVEERLGVHMYGPNTCKEMRGHPCHTLTNAKKGRVIAWYPNTC